MVVSATEAVATEADGDEGCDVMEMSPMPMATEAAVRAALKMVAATKAEAMEVVGRLQCVTAGSKRPESLPWCSLEAGYSTWRLSM